MSVLAKEATMTEEKKNGRLVTIVISTHDEVNVSAPGAKGKSMLACSIESVVAQSNRDWELWVVSDHPPDPVRLVIEELIASFRDDRIHYEDLEEDSRRQSISAMPGVECKQRGVQRSKGELLAFLDPGVSFEREHLGHCVDAFDESGFTLDLVYCDTRILYVGNSDEKDLLQKAVALPYHFMGAIWGEKFSEQLKGQLLPPPIAPLAGMPYTLEKPAWDATAAKKLESYCFIEMSNAVMTRQAYEAAGGFRKLLPLDGNLWRDMIRAGQSRFRHLPHVGIRYTTDSIAQYRKHYALGAAAKLNLPFDFAHLRGEMMKSPAHSDHPKMQPSPSQAHPPRILFMSEASAISHVARPSLLAAYLHGQGYDVCLARDPRYSNLVCEDGLKVVDLKSLPGSIAQARLARHEPVHDADTLDRYVQEDLRVIREFKPDIVVGDQRHSLAISSRLTEVPYVNIADGHWSPAIDVQYELPNSPLSGAIGMPLSNLLFQFIQPLAFAYQALPINVVRIKYGLPGISPDIRVCNTYGDYTVFPNDPGLFTLKKPLPPRQTFIGPILWSPAVEKPEWWNQLPEDRPIVYVSLGSTGQPGLLNSVFNVLAQLPVTAMVATAGRWQAATVPENVFVADFLPGTEAALRSRLVICNGGTMSGQQALSAGTPYLGLISNLDQMMFSTVVRRSSACELLRDGDVNESTLRTVILRMLAQEKYKIAAATIAARTKDLESCQKFEMIICSILEDRVGTNPMLRSRSA
jgi:UDP:flavonoid glycosyltransferase YjiC (YdhE family)